MRNTVVFVLSHNYSGSTWLSLMLGSHSHAFYVGELNKFYSKKYPKPCALCEKHVRVCPYFYDVKQIHPSEIHTLMFERTGRSVLVDNSKRIKWSSRFLGDGSFQHKFVHLIKDPRALYYSLQIRNRADEFSEWAPRHAEINRFLAEYELDSFLLTYNDLAERTEESLSALCKWLGLRFEDSQQEYWRFEHHGPGENGATSAFLERSRTSDEKFYGLHRRTSFVDLRWQEKLDEKTRSTIERDSGVRDLLAELQLDFSTNGIHQEREIHYAAQSAA